MWLYYRWVWQKIWIALQILNISLQYRILKIAVWCTNVIFLDIIRRSVYILKHDVSENGLCLRLQVKPTQLGPIDRLSGKICFSCVGTIRRMSSLQRWFLSWEFSGAKSHTYTKKKKLRVLSPRANYTDRATTACRWSYCQLLLIEGVVWSAQRFPTVIFSVF
jgi:hypothetical protein